MSNVAWPCSLPDEHLNARVTSCRRQPILPVDSSRKQRSPASPRDAASIRNRFAPDLPHCDHRRRAPASTPSAFAPRPMARGTASDCLRGYTYRSWVKSFELIPIIDLNISRSGFTLPGFYEFLETHQKYCPLHTTVGSKLNGLFPFAMAE